MVAEAQADPADVARIFLWKLLDGEGYRVRRPFRPFPSRDEVSAFVRDCGESDMSLANALAVYFMEPIRRA